MSWAVLASGSSLQRMAFGCLQCGIKARGALLNAVCQKSFRLNSIEQDRAADVVSFVASDINKVFDGMQVGWVLRLCQRICSIT